MSQAALQKSLNSLKKLGILELTDEQGEKVIWLWDYATNRPRMKSEMTKQEMKASKLARKNIK